MNFKKSGFLSHPRGVSECLRMITGGGGQGLDYVIKIFSATEKNAMVNIILISPDPDKYTYILRLVIKIVKSLKFSR